MLTRRSLLAGLFAAPAVLTLGAHMPISAQTSELPALIGFREVWTMGLDGLWLRTHEQGGKVLAARWFSNAPFAVIGEMPKRVETTYQISAETYVRMFGAEARSG